MLHPAGLDFPFIGHFKKCNNSPLRNFCQVRFLAFYVTKIKENLLYVDYIIHLKLKLLKLNDIKWLSTVGKFWIKNVWNCQWQTIGSDRFNRKVFFVEFGSLAHNSLSAFPDTS